MKDLNILNKSTPKSVFSKLDVGSNVSKNDNTNCVS